MEYYYNGIKFFDALAFSFQNDMLSSDLNTVIGKDNLTVKQSDFLKLLRDTVTICSFFGVDSFDEIIKSLNDYINELDNALRLGNKTAIRNSLMFIRVSFSEPKDNSAHAMLVKKLELLNEDEKNRLNEAFNCYVSDLYYSAIVMSVSAVESRLFNIMQYIQTQKNLDKMTLGNLINEYLENQDCYNKIIPQKHLQLLNYCNTYRVLSVHPKKEKITKSNATAILSMTCSFLFDECMKIGEG